MLSQCRFQAPGSILGTQGWSAPEPLGALAMRAVSVPWPRDGVWGGQAPVVGSIRQQQGPRLPLVRRAGVCGCRAL